MKHIYSFRIKGFLFLAFLLTSPFWGATLGYASTFSVAKTGSNSNSCIDAQSQSTPKLTIKAGISCLSSGDTLLIKRGTYVESFNNVIPGGTSWTNATTVAADTGETVIIKGPVGAARVFYFRGNIASYIILDGLILDGTDIVWDIVKIDQFTDGDAAHHIRIINSELRNGPSKAVLATNTTNNIQIQQSNIHDNGQADYDQDGFYSYNFYIQGEDNLIENCDISGAGAHGVHIYNGYTFQSNNNIVRNNIIHDNGLLNSGGKTGGGILIGSGTNNQIYNNLIYNNAHKGIRTNSGVIMWNNNIYGHSQMAVELAYVSGSEIRNNIFWQNGTDGMVSHGVTFMESNNLTIGPRFLDPSNFDFRLQSDSPAIDAGFDLSDKFSKDFIGTKRGFGGGWDIGAYEFVGTTVDNVPPLSPTDVVIF
jgi:hypothetical protein